MGSPYDDQAVSPGPPEPANPKELSAPGFELQVMTLAVGQNPVTLVDR